MKPWWHDLKVGDVVCDCRCRHLKIIEIQECRAPYRWIEKVLDKIPWWSVYGWLYGKVIESNLLTYVYDLQLSLEGGSYASVVNCCEPIDSEHSHPDFNGLGDKNVLT